MTNVSHKPTAKIQLQRQRVMASTRVSPSLYDWLVKTPEFAFLSVSKTLELAIQFACNNEHGFKQFCEEQSVSK